MVIFAKNRQILKKVCFFLAEINGDFCKKSMKSERKSKKNPGEINGDFYQKPAKFYFSKNACEIWFSMLKVAKNHQNLTSQNWCPFGHRTFPSCFRARLRFAMVKPAKNGPNFTSQKMHVKYGFQC